MIKRVYAYHAQRVGGDGRESWGTITRRSWFPRADLVWRDIEHEMKSSFGVNMAIRYFARIQ